MQKDRDEVLGATAEDIRKLSVYLESALKSGAICAVGSESALRKGSDLFMEIKPLI